MYRATICVILLVLLQASNLRAQTSPAPNAQTPPPASHDWPGFLGPTRNGKSDEHGLPKTWPAEGPPVVWQATVGTGYSAPAIADGRVFQFSRFENNARLNCFDAKTGTQKWTCDYPTAFEDMLGYNNGPRATPMVDGPNVYTYGAEGVLQCVRVADGQMVWRVDTFKDFGVVKNFFGVGSTPLVYGDLLLVCVGGSPPGGPTDVYAANGQVEPNGTAIVAFEKTTGKVRWKTGNELASYSSPVLAKIDGKDVVFLLARGGLMAIDPQKGETISEFPYRAKRLESVNASTPVVVGNEIFVSETYEIGSAVVRFDGGKFTELWSDGNRRRNQAMALHWNTPIEHDGYLYGSSGYHTPEAELRCVEWKTGKVMWSEPNMGRSSLLLVDGTLICVSEDGTLRILRPNPQKYAELAKWEYGVGEGEDPATPGAIVGKARSSTEANTALLPYPTWAAPALSNGLLYLEGANRLVCLKLW
ncbi:MAG TPA: PQQ-binding-like beta-propeller repeat protein [Lacipirellulaceae bacterium]|nr:PQQ-binding-like beta-propeller repeat protein [Lacipirellulaceae bacterium]